MKKGYFGKFGGSFVSAEIQEELDKIEKEYNRLKKDKDFIGELNTLRRDYQGRPTPLYYCKNLTEKIGGAKIYLKREDLNHTGAHKINHCIGEALLAKHLGKTKIIAETGAGQHGLAIATVCTMLGLECEVHMGSVDIKKQSSNVSKMKMLGATIVECTAGDGTLKDAVDSAFASFCNLLYWFGGWSSSVSNDGSRFSISYWKRGKKTNQKARRQTSRLCCCMCWWWIKCNGHFLSFYKRGKCETCWR